MNTLTVERISDIAYGIEPSVSFHPASIAYLQLLCAPYAEAVQDATVDGLRLWFPLAYKPTLGAKALEYMNRVLEKYGGIQGDVTEEVVAREFALTFLMEEIIDKSLDARDVLSEIIWPWDIQTVISNDHDLSEIFGFPATATNQLPVDVTVNAQKFSFELTMDFVGGLLLFSDKGVGNVDFNVSLFGAPFKSSDVVSEGEEMPTRFDGLGRGKAIPFTVSVNGKVYEFDTPDFMRGFATGAQWAGVDHRAYWTDLKQIISNTDGVSETAITF